MDQMGGVMFVEAYKRCYDFAGRDEYKVIPMNCPIGKECCVGGFVWIGEEKPEYSVEYECEFYDKDSFKEYDCKADCNFYGGVK